MIKAFIYKARPIWNIKIIFRNKYNLKKYKNKIDFDQH